MPNTRLDPGRDRNTSNCSSTKRLTVYPRDRFRYALTEAQSKNRENPGGRSDSDLPLPTGNNNRAGSSGK